MLIFCKSKKKFALFNFIHFCNRKFLKFIHFGNEEKKNKINLLVIIIKNSYKIFLIILMFLKFMNNSIPKLSLIDKSLNENEILKE